MSALGSSLLLVMHRTRRVAPFIVLFCERSERDSPRTYLSLDETASDFQQPLPLDGPPQSGQAGLLKNRHRKLCTCSAWGYLGDTMMTTEKLAPYVLRALAEAQQEGTLLDLESLALALKVRRPDVRKTVSALHQRGLVDALRLRLSLEGFALGSALLTTELPQLRRPKPAASAVDAA
jgi:hypothetical protein